MDFDWNAIRDIGLKFLGGIAILIIGWIIAKIISGMVRKLLSKNKFINEKIIGTVSDKKKHSLPKIVSRIVYYIIMIFVLIATFQFWKLTAVTVPLNTILNNIFEYLPLVGGALILLVIAWISATILKKIIISFFEKSKIDEKVNEQFEEEDKNIKIGTTIAEFVYWLVFLLFLPAILSALNLGGILSPVQNMVDIFLSFVPNIFAALIVVVIGFFVSKFVKNIVQNLLKALKVDQFGRKSGITGEGQETSLAELLGNIVFFLIFIPIIISALDILGIQSIASPATNMLSSIFNFIPVLFSAAIIIVFAFFIGKIVGSLVASILIRLGFDKIPNLLGFKEFKLNLSDIIGKLIMIIIILFAAIEASDVIGFSKVASLTEKFLILASNVLVGIIIIALGLYLANFISNIILNSNMKHGKFLSLITKIAVLILAITMGLTQMGLASSIIEYAFIFLVGAIAVAFALSFGLGGREWAAKKLEEIELKIKKED